MSTGTTTSFRELTKTRLQGSLDRYRKDIKHFTDEQFASCPGGEARSPLAITAEVGLFNHACAKIISGEDMPEMTEQAIGEVMASIDTREKATEKLISGTAALETAIVAASDDDYQNEVKAPWGQTVTKQYMAEACCMHMDYHDGQLNIIQCMNGDTTVHWMEE
ncbi:MAG: hypothetical protein IH944_10420 [Armatimonadetes bacterium]|nr:hypothetical protein [Armatimonadota bacterium]